MDMDDVVELGGRRERIAAVGWYGTQAGSLAQKR